MWHTSYTAETGASPAAVWEALRSLCAASTLGLDSDAVTLHGPFAVGTCITVIRQGLEPMHTVIAEIEPGRVYSDRTYFGGLLLRFRHELQAAATGGTTLTQSLEITGPFCDLIGPKIGRQIAGYFPAATIKLFRNAELRTVREEEGVLPSINTSPQGSFESFIVQPC